jgi:uncharacterized protein YqhQ
MALNIAISLGFFIFMYKFIPFAAARSLQRWAPETSNTVLFAVVEGVIRLAIFLTFIWLTSRWSEIRRVYRYHGAEHKTVFAFENGDPLSAGSVQRYSTFHPRCGTSFLITVMLISMGIYAMVPVHGFWMGFASRIVLLPVIAGVSYEIIRYAARRRSSLFAMMTAPGLWLQRITTQPPDDGQVECAIVALNNAMELEKVHGGEMVIASKPEPLCGPPCGGTCTPTFSSTWSLFLPRVTESTSFRLRRELSARLKVQEAYV